MNAIMPRSTDHLIDPDMLARWSPRSFTDEAIGDVELMTLFEAARWAPSAFNGQPWKFVYVRRGSADWQKFVDLLLPFNQEWAQHAAALVFVASRVSHTNANGEVTTTRSHAFDAGASWSMLALQAIKLGWHAHAMGGFDHDRAIAELGVPEGWRIEVAIAIGRQGDGSSLNETLRVREVPSQRKPLTEIISEGRF
ncbi:nitroreductase family protein [Devosia sp. BK]|uniref:nitroreductase family protein n=1 Tax=Devosia sp. BK TaxID=2871706 RepID=UPI00293B208D|nr:nitroreductase family protein [Devosia sp. BK]MDV3252467.1 nitroreductase family protein [Devosia sp. BK]